MTLYVRVKFRAFGITLHTAEEWVDLREHLPAAAIAVLRSLGKQTLLDARGILVEVRDR